MKTNEECIFQEGEKHFDTVPFQLLPGCVNFSPDTLTHFCTVTFIQFSFGSFPFAARAKSFSSPRHGKIHLRRAPSALHFTREWRYFIRRLLPIDKSISIAKDLKTTSISVPFRISEHPETRFSTHREIAKSAPPKQKPSCSRARYVSYPSDSLLNLRPLDSVVLCCSQHNCTMYFLRSDKSQWVTLIIICWLLLQNLTSLQSFTFLFYTSSYLYKRI